MSMTLEAPLSHTGTGARRWERWDLPARGEDECWEGEDSPFQDILPGNCSGIALPTCKFPPRQHLLSTCRSVALLPRARGTPEDAVPVSRWFPWERSRKALVSFQRHSVCSTDMGNTICNPEKAGQQGQTGRIQAEPGCGCSSAAGPCSSLISLPWHRTQEPCVVSLQHCSSPCCFLRAPVPTCLARLIIFSLQT